MGNFTAAVNPAKFQVCVCVYVGVGGGVSIGPPLLIYMSSHENHSHTSPDAPGLLIKFIWAHINHATKTF